MTTGEPTNHIAYVHGNVIRNIGAYINACGGASGLEWGSSWCVIEDSLDIGWVGPIGTAMCSCSGTTLTVTGYLGGLSLDDFATMRFRTAGGLGNVTISGGGFPANTTVVSGSGSTWIVSNAMTFGTTKLTFLGNAGGACDQDGSDIDDGCQNVLRERDYIHDCWGPSTLDWMGGGDGPHYNRYNIGVNCGAEGEGNNALQGNGSTAKCYSYNNTYISMRNPAPVSGTPPAGNFAPWAVNNLTGFTANNIYITENPNFEVQQPSTGFSATYLVTACNFGGVGLCCGSIPGYQSYQLGGTIYPNNTGGASWVAAVGAVGTLFLDPLFHNPWGTDTPADWQLNTSSPLIGQGVDVTMISSTYTGGDVIPVAKDFFGNLPGPPNIGAMAYGPGV
jgi:hypothetical protein